MLWIIPSLFAVSVTGLAYVVLRALRSGAETYSGTYSEETAKQFEDIFLFIPPKRIAEAGWAVSAVVFLAVFLLTGDLMTVPGVIIGLIFGTIAGTLALYSPRHFLAVLKKRRLRRFNEQLVDTLVNMSNALKAGFSITQTFESVVRDGENPIAQEFGVFLQQTRVGVSFSEALSNLEQRVDSDDMTLVATAIETARKTGGNLTEVFEKISATIRERMRIEVRIRTLTSQGRMQGIVVGSMPVLIGVVMIILDPDTMLPFLQSRVGIAVIIVMGILISLGALTIRKIINIDI